MNTNTLKVLRAGGLIGAEAMGGSSFVVMFLVVLFLALSPTTSLAQCGQGQGQGIDIKICADELMMEQERSIDILENMTQQMGAQGLLQADEMEAANRELGFLRRNHNRRVNEKDDATEKELNNLVVKGEPSSCELRLLPRYAMGPPPRPVCTDQEVADNKCEEVCEFTDEEKERNRGRGLRLEESLAQALEQTRNANDELEEDVAMMASLSAQAVTAAGSCTFNNPHPAIGEPFPPASILLHNGLLVAQETITTLGKDICNQTAACFNTSTACTVLTILEGVQKGLTSFVNSINGNFTSATVDATFECVNDLKAASDGQAEDLEEIKMDISSMQADIDAMQASMEELKTLLLTPQGVREGFPEK